MKKVLLVRHAKSSWADAGVSDMERPLNDRGERDAPEMAKRLHKKKHLKIDAILSSPARRALKTAQYFAKAFGIHKKDIQLIPGLYMASANQIMDAISSAPDKAGCIAVFGHNPGITELANELTEQRIDNMPTCSIFAVEADADDWKVFDTADRKFLFFEYPKKGE